MELLGIDPLEVMLILLIALIILGPKDIIKTGKTVGKVLRKIVTSPTYHMVQNTSREIRDLPNRLMRESGLDELQDQLPNTADLNKQLGLDELNQNMIKPPEVQKDDAFSAWTTPAGTSPGAETDPPGDETTLADSPKTQENHAAGDSVNAQ
jgi:sec-independent protein translocase protein TatB